MSMEQQRSDSAQQTTPETPWNPLQHLHDQHAEHAAIPDDASQTEIPAGIHTFREDYYSPHEKATDLPSRHDAERRAIVTTGILGAASLLVDILFKRAAGTPIDSTGRLNISPSPAIQDIPSPNTLGTFTHEAKTRNEKATQFINKMGMAIAGLIQNPPNNCTVEAMTQYVDGQPVMPNSGQISRPAISEVPGYNGAEYFLTFTADKFDDNGKPLPGTITSVTAATQLLETRTSTRNSTTEIDRVAFALSQGITFRQAGPNNCQVEINSAIPGASPDEGVTTLLNTRDPRFAPTEVLNEAATVFTQILFAFNAESPPPINVGPARMDNTQTNSNVNPGA